MVKGGKIDGVSAQLRTVAGVERGRPFDGTHQKQLLVGGLVERRAQPSAELRQKIHAQVVVLEAHLVQLAFAGVGAAFVRHREGFVGLDHAHRRRRGQECDG